MSDLRAQRDLIDAILAVTEERDAAFLQRDADPARWAAAKQAYAETRRKWRQVHEMHRGVVAAAPPAGASVSAVAPQAQEV